MKKNEAKEAIRKEMLKHADRAEWLSSWKEYRLATHERIKHLAYWEILDIIEAEENGATIIAKIALLMYEHGSSVDYYLEQGLKELAEEAQMRYETYFHVHHILEEWEEKCDLEKQVAQ